MKIEFITEHNITYAVAFKEVWQGRVHEELLFAEIESRHGKVFLRWESQWGDVIEFRDLESAKLYTLNNYYKFNPISNGLSYEIEED